MRDSLRVTGPLDYLWNHIHLLSAENPGAFLNLGADLPETWRFWLFTISCTVFLAGLAAYILNTKPHPSALIGLTLILAGGFGNLIDRYAQGHVTDFILLTAGNLHTGIFNLADVAITTGAAILAFVHRPKPRTEAGGGLRPRALKIISTDPFWDGPPDRDGATISHP